MLFILHILSYTHLKLLFIDPTSTLPPYLISNT